MKHFVYSILFFLFSVPIMGMESGSPQKTAHFLVYGDEQTASKSLPGVDQQKPSSAMPATLWERFCMGQHYLYISGFSLYAARHFLQKPAIVSKTLGGTLFFCGAALITAVIYPFSFWQKPVESFREKLSQCRP